MHWTYVFRDKFNFELFKICKLVYFNVINKMLSCNILIICIL